MAGILGRFTKQSTETLDYRVEFADWFDDPEDPRTDLPASITVDVEAGITLVTSTRVGTLVFVVLSGGADGAEYKVTVRMTTSSGIVKEADFSVRIKDI